MTLSIRSGTALIIAYNIQEKLESKLSTIPFTHGCYITDLAMRSRVLVCPNQSSIIFSIAHSVVKIMPEKFNT